MLPPDVRTCLSNGGGGRMQTEEIWAKCE